MNNNRSILNNYVLIVKTLHGDPSDKIAVVFKGTHGQTEYLVLGKSQSYAKAFGSHQTDLFTLISQMDVGQLQQVEFHVTGHGKFKEWKYNHLMVIYGTRVYLSDSSERSLGSSTQSRSIVPVAEAAHQSEESVYYAFIKTGNESCSKDCFPKLSLYGPDQRCTTIDLKTPNSMQCPSINNTHPLEKSQLDLYQWHDQNMNIIERIQLHVVSKQKPSKCYWPIEWIFVIHHGHVFTGRIFLNRTIKPDRMITINLQQTPITKDQGDALMVDRKEDDPIFSRTLLNLQSNAATDEVGRYYVMIRNTEGTSGDVYIDFHGDQRASSGEQGLLKCENYPDHPFGSKHTDLYHVKALEVGLIQSVTLRLDQTDREHSLTLDSLYIIHNSIMYEFDLQGTVLNKGQSKKKCHPKPRPTVPPGKACYFLATHTADKMLSGTNASFKVMVTGTTGTFGPIELKESLTNGHNPFEKECIDLFHLEDNDIGDPVFVSITLEPKGLLPDIFSGAKCERIMLTKDGEYNSLWQVVGDLKSKETKTIPLPSRARLSLKDTGSPPLSHPVLTNEPTRINTATQMASATLPNKPIVSNVTSTPMSTETKTSTKTERTVPLTQEIKSTMSTKNFHPAGDHRSNALTMAEIEEHQKRHTYAHTLTEAEQNYRELRRLLRKMNGSTGRQTNIRSQSKTLMNEKL